MKRTPRKEQLHQSDRWPGHAGIAGVSHITHGARESRVTCFDDGRPSKEMSDEGVTNKLGSLFLSAVLGAVLSGSDANKTIVFQTACFADDH